PAHRAPPAGRADGSRWQQVADSLPEDGRCPARVRARARSTRSGRPALDDPAPDGAKKEFLLHSLRIRSARPPVPPTPAAPILEARPTGGAPFCASHASHVSHVSHFESHGDNCEAWASATNSGRSGRLPAAAGSALEGAGPGRRPVIPRRDPVGAGASTDNRR